MIIPYWTSPDGRAVVYHADCLDALPQLEVRSVELLLQDPPYGMGKESEGVMGDLSLIHI